MKHRKLLLAAFALFILLACQFGPVRIDLTDPTPTPVGPVLDAPTQTDGIEGPVPPPIEEPFFPQETTSTPVPLIRSEMLEEASDVPAYTISIVYAVLENGNANEIFNQDISQIITSTKADFITETEGIEEWRAENMPEMSSSLYIQYTEENLSNGIASVKMLVSTYYAGAAHPFSYFITYNFSMILGREVMLEELFTPGSNFLDLLANLCQADLQAQGVLDFPEGALPDPVNYQNWNIKPDGLLISFGEYQVAPYAAGPQESLIPYSDLQPIIDPNGPLGPFLP